MRRRRTELNPSAQRLQVDVGTAQWQGTRPAQNDVISVITFGDGRGICVMVADGIGIDAQAGAAAQTAIQAMQFAYSGLPPTGNPILTTAAIVGSAHRAVVKMNAQALDRGQMTTGAAVGCALVREDALAFSSVGNVRIFLNRAGALLPLNRDYLLSTETETREILDGEEEPDIDQDMNLRLTAYAGMDGLKELDWPSEELALLPGDSVLIMSSGMYGILHDEEWSQLLDECAAQQAADEAIARVRERQNASQSNASLAILGFS